MAGAGYKLFQTGDVLTATEVNTYLQQQVTMVFANSTARTTALSGVLAEGMMSYLQDTNTVEVYNGSSWVNVGNAGDITAVTAGTGISGGGSSGDVTITNSMATAIDAKGDLIVGTGADTFSRLAVGTNGHTLVADSSVSPTGLKWAVDPVADVVTTAGDLIYGTAADTITRLGIGTAGQVLTVNSGATAPEWKTPAGGGGKVLQVVNATTSTATTIATTTFTDTGITATITPSATNSKILILISAQHLLNIGSGSTSYIDAKGRIMRDATAIQTNNLSTQIEVASGQSAMSIANHNSWVYLDSPNTTSAVTYKLQAGRTNSLNQNVIYQQGSNNTSTITLLEIGA